MTDEETYPVLCLRRAYRIATAIHTSAEVVQDNQTTRVSTNRSTMELDVLMREAPLALALRSESWAPNTILTPIPPTALMVQRALRKRDGERGQKFSARLTRR